MCGIFGLMKCGDPAHSGTAVSVLRALGTESEERGKDSAGLAMLVAADQRRETTQPAHEDAAKRACAIDQVFIVKDTVRFSQIDLSHMADALRTATVFLGHTRAATQGAADNPVNASPLLAGALVGTHNGDVDPSSVPGYKALRKYAHGGTDTEIVYLALAAARRDRRRMVGVLKALHGRAALAFVDRSRPDRLYLARAALSPLCYTHDQHGNFYYASNPDWFRRIAKANPEVVFDDITLIPEGHLLTVSTLTGQVEDSRRFTPTCRESDTRLMTIAVHRGFTAEDKAADLALQRHHVLQPSLGPWRDPATVPATLPATTTAATAGTASPARTVYTSDPLDAWRSTGPDYASYGWTPAGETRLAERLAAEEPDLWDAPADDAWGPTGSHDDGPEIGYDALSDPGIDWDEVENLCWAAGHDFDHHTYERLMDAPSPAQARSIYDGLKKAVAARREMSAA